MSSARVVVGLVALAVVGGGAGFGLSALADDGTTRVSEAVPVTASPTLPGDGPSTEPEPPADDIDYRTLVPPTRFVRHRIGNDLQVWSYLAPQGWEAYTVPGEQVVPPAEVDERQELRFRPADEPVLGGFSLRVKAVDDHVPSDDMVADKMRDLRSFEEFTVLERTPDSLYFTYRTSDSDRLRYNFFRWFAAPGVREATLEMSVVGRRQDEVGLRGLFDQFRDGLRPVG